MSVVYSVTQSLAGPAPVKVDGPAQAARERVVLGEVWKIRAHSLSATRQTGV